MASPQVSFVSSSGVKEIAGFGGKVDVLVPEGVARRFEQLFPDGRPGTPANPQERPSKSYLARVTTCGSGSGTHTRSCRSCAHEAPRARLPTGSSRGSATPTKA